MKRNVASHFYSHFQTRLVTNQFVAGSTFCDEMFICCAFPRLPARDKLVLQQVTKSQVWRDSLVFLSNQKSVFTQQTDLLQDGFERGWQNTQLSFPTSFAAMLRNKLHHLLPDLR